MLALARIRSYNTDKYLLDLLGSLCSFLRPAPHRLGSHVAKLQSGRCKLNEHYMSITWALHERHFGHVWTPESFQGNALHAALLQQLATRWSFGCTTWEDKLRRSAQPCKQQGQTRNMAKHGRTWRNHIRVCKLQREGPLTPAYKFVFSCQDVSETEMPYFCGTIWPWRFKDGIVELLVLEVAFFQLRLDLEFGAPCPWGPVSAVPSAEVQSCRENTSNISSTL